MSARPSPRSGSAKIRADFQFWRRCAFSHELWYERAPRPGGPGIVRLMGIVNRARDCYDDRGLRHPVTTKDWVAYLCQSPRRDYFRPRKTRDNPRRLPGVWKRLADAKRAVEEAIKRHDKAGSHTARLGGSA